MADILEALRTQIGDDVQQVYLPEALFKRAADEITSLRKANERWRSNYRDIHHALVAMRNDINEHIPMPSIESDLLQGPEASVFCAAVAAAVIAKAEPKP